MEKLYRKVGKRYVTAGYDFPTLSEGIWLVQERPGSRRTSSLVWRIGEIKRPVDIATRVGVLALQDDLVDYLRNLSDENSQEYQELKEKLGSYALIGTPQISNIAISDFADAILNRIGSHFEKI
jgi:hypothetical protein